MLKRFTTKTNRKKALKHIRNRNTFAADCIKKKKSGFPIILIRLLLMTINYSGKPLNHFFQTREIHKSQIKLAEKR